MDLEARLAACEARITALEEENARVRAAHATLLETLRQRANEGMPNWPDQQLVFYLKDIRELNKHAY